MKLFRTYAPLAVVSLLLGAGLAAAQSSSTGGIALPVAVAQGGTGGTTATGSGAVVLATSPTLVTPTLGVAAATSLALGCTISTNDICGAQWSVRASDGKITSTGAINAGGGGTSMNGGASGVVSVISTGGFEFASGGSAVTGLDTGVWRLAAGSVAIGNSSSGDASGQVTTTKHTWVVHTASGVAPGATKVTAEAVCGTNAGSAKIILYAGTSTTPVTLLDNIGSGVTGC